MTKAKHVSLILSLSNMKFTIHDLLHIPFVFNAGGAWISKWSNERCWGKFKTNWTMTKITSGKGELLLITVISDISACISRVFNVIKFYTFHLFICTHSCINISFCLNTSALHGVTNTLLHNALIYALPYVLRKNTLMLASETLWVIIMRSHCCHNDMQHRYTGYWQSL